MILVHYRTRLLFVFLVLILTWLKASGCLEMVTDPDQGLFESFAYHMEQGKALYIDIFDHKPPLIFYLDQLFLNLFGTSENAISYGSLFLCLVQTVFFYLLLFQFFGEELLAFFGTIFFICVFYNYSLFGSGNYTEQYGVLCVTISYYFLFRFGESYMVLFAFLSGLFVFLAGFFKEPFILLEIPIFIQLLYFIFKKPNSKQGIVWFVLANVFGIVLIFTALWWSGVLRGFLEQFNFSLAYAGRPRDFGFFGRLANNKDFFLKPLHLNSILSLPYLWGMYVLLLSGFLLNKRTKALGFFILLVQIIDFLTTSLSGQYFPHYYIQSTPITAIIVVGGLWVWLELFKTPRSWGFVILAIVLAGLTCFSSPLDNIALNPEKKFNDPIVAYLNDHEPHKPRDISLAGKDIGFYLLRAEGISKSRYIVPYPYHWVAGEKVAKEYCENVKQAKPKYIIYSGTWAEIVKDSKLDEYIMQNYSEVIHTDLREGFTAHLLKRNEENTTIF